MIEGKPGTGTLSSSGRTVVGCGTRFSEELQRGDQILSGGFLSTVLAIYSDTAMAVADDASPPLSGLPFRIIRVWTWSTPYYEARRLGVRFGRWLRRRARLS